MSDDKLDDLLRLAREEYHDPPETPRDALWRRIIQQRSALHPRGEHSALDPRGERSASTGSDRGFPARIARRFRRESTGASLGRRIPRASWQLLFATAAAATLLVVFWGRQEPAPPAAPGVKSLQERIRESQKAEGPSAAYQAVATSHLSRTDAMLTTLRQDAKDPESRKAVTEWARELLMDTRLLMDSPAGQDEELRPLLLDVELALAEIARLDGEDPAEQKRIEEGMDRGALLGRVRFKTGGATVSIGI
jgi:hypothetical protein